MLLKRQTADVDVGAPTPLSSGTSVPAPGDGSAQTPSGDGAPAVRVKSNPFGSARPVDTATKLKVGSGGGRGSEAFGKPGRGPHGVGRGSKIETERLVRCFQELDEKAAKRQAEAEAEAEAKRQAEAEAEERAARAARDAQQQAALSRSQPQPIVLLQHCLLYTSPSPRDS